MSVLIKSGCVVGRIQYANDVYHVRVVSWNESDTFIENERRAKNFNNFLIYSAKNLIYSMRAGALRPDKAKEQGDQG